MDIDTLDYYCPIRKVSKTTGKIEYFFRLKTLNINSAAVKNIISMHYRIIFYDLMH